jgi:hypothetical protein
MAKTSPYKDKVTFDKHTDDLTDAGFDSLKTELKNFNKLLLDSSRINFTNPNVSGRNVIKALNADTLNYYANFKIDKQNEGKVPIKYFVKDSNEFVVVYFNEKFETIEDLEGILEYIITNLGKIK